MAPRRHNHEQLPVQQSLLRMMGEALVEDQVARCVRAAAEDVVAAEGTIECTVYHCMATTQLENV